MKTNIANLILQITLCILVVACGGSPANQIPLETVNTRSSSPTLVETVTANITATVSPTVVPTIVPEPTYTEAPGNIIPTLIGQLTLTPIPTLSQSRRETMLQELLSTNGGCELP